MTVSMETRAKRQGIFHFLQHLENLSEQAVLRFSVVPRDCFLPPQPEVTRNFRAAHRRNQREPEVGRPEFLPPNLPRHLLCQKITRRVRNSSLNPITCHFLHLQSLFRTAYRPPAGLASCSSARYQKSTYFPATWEELHKIGSSVPFRPQTNRLPVLKVAARVADWIGTMQPQIHLLTPYGRA